MLNRDQLQELGRFKLLMRRSSGESIQIERFLTDAQYQTRLLDLAEEFDDDELLMLSITLRARLGRLGEGDATFCSALPHTAAAAVAAPSTVEVVPAAMQVVNEPISPVESEPVRRTMSLQDSVDAAPPRPKGLFGGLLGGSRAEPDVGGQRYVTSLR
jgi:hypothetical protein